MREKRNLKDVTRYSRVYLRTSLSHTDRLIQLNFHQILKELPGGEKYRLTGNGRIVLKEEPGEVRHTRPNDDDAEARAHVRENRLPAGGYRGRGRGRRGINR